MESSEEILLGGFIVADVAFATGTDQSLPVISRRQKGQEKIDAGFNSIFFETVSTKKASLDFKAFYVECSRQLNSKVRRSHCRACHISVV
jgi:hypothetical protein